MIPSEPVRDAAASAVERLSKWGAGYVLDVDSLDAFRSDVLALLADRDRLENLEDEVRGMLARIDRAHNETTDDAIRKRLDFVIGVTLPLRAALSDSKEAG